MTTTSTTTCTDTTKTSETESTVDEQSDPNDRSNSMIEWIYQHSGQACTDRAHTILAMEALLQPREQQPPRPTHSNVYGNGPILLSDIPSSCLHKNSSIVVGIDEAGRGSVLGPMVYGMAFWNENDHSKETQELRAAFGDSKQLTEEKREMLFQKILSSSFSNDGNTGSSIGFGVKILHASEISRHMLRRSSVYNLNQMSHDAAMALIRSLQQQLLLLSKNHHAASISTCYIDTVGNPQTYQRQLERAFPGIRFVVESKADDTYPPCSAASIVAKVTRDRMIRNWTFSEPQWNIQENMNHNNHDNPTSCTSIIPRNRQFGSGYPSDPICKKWLQDQLEEASPNNIFGYPDIVRFSWSTVQKLLQSHAIPVRFAADDDDNEENGGGDGNKEPSYKIRLGLKRQQEHMAAFFGTNQPCDDYDNGTITASQKKKQYSRKKHLPYFNRKKLKIVTNL